MTRPRYLPDNFTLALLAVVMLASLLPARGWGAVFFDGLTTVAVALLFFLHGVKLSRQAILAGVGHWRLHALVFAATFIMFPIFGLLLKPLLLPLVTPQIYTGVLYLCVLPATVQSAVVFTSIARGNVAAAVCSASGSTLLGVFVTPLLVNLIVLPNGGASSSLLDSIEKILLQLMAPFIAGHLLRPWISGWSQRHAAVVSLVDRGSILLVVYTAFSASVIEGLWKQVPLSALAGLLAVCAIILALALASTTFAARHLGFDTADEITIVFCGSKKGLANGIPMAKVLFPAQAIGAMVLPLMLFHQMQLMVCAAIAQRYARREQHR
jgi:sodium/bile acid cotransporter 7